MAGQGSPQRQLLTAATAGQAFMVAVAVVVAARSLVKQREWAEMVVRVFASSPVGNGL